MTAPTTLAELSRAAAEAKGWTHLLTDDRGNSFGSPPGVAYRDDIHLTAINADPARLYELEGELQQAGWQFFFNDSWNIYRAYDRDQPPFTYPGTPEGRARLILRAWLEMKL